MLPLTGVRFGILAKELANNANYGNYRQIGAATAVLCGPIRQKSESGHGQSYSTSVTEAR